MAFNTIPSTLTQYISTNSKKSVKDRVRKAQFGDGYLQVSKDGLNSTQDFWELSFEPLTGSAKIDMETFLNTYGCETVFLWTPLGESTAKKWSRVENSLEIQLLSTEMYVIKFTIQQRFDLG